MRTAEAFGIERGPDDDWYDRHLTVDTKLFVDPFLLLVEGGRWAVAHDELIEHFVECYRLVARATSPTSVSGLAAGRLLTFPEPAEFGLGYTAASTSGAGSGARYARQIADGIAVAIARGLTVPEHIEEIGILNEGIGADRISDAVCNVLKHQFIEYTQEVMQRHGIAGELHRVRNARVSTEHARWLAEDVTLPTNPVTGRPIILVPTGILNSLPVLNAEDWFDANLNADLRAQLNLSVGRRASKADIVDFARKQPDRVREWAREQTTRRDLQGYDFQDDPRGVVAWDGLPAQFAVNHPLAGMAKPSTQDELNQLVDGILNQFKHFIEDQRGWSLLHNSDGTEKPEEAAQLAFLGMAQPYLRRFDIELDREVELGRGPVDFKVSSGSTFRVLIEVKKAHNGKFWHGLQEQLPSYLKSDACQDGWYAALRYRNNRASARRMQELPGMVAETATATGRSLRYVAIDARRKASASNI